MVMMELVGGVCDKRLGLCSCSDAKFVPQLGGEPCSATVLLAVGVALRVVHAILHLIVSRGAHLAERSDAFLLGHASQSVHIKEARGPVAG